MRLIFRADFGLYIDHVSAWLNFGLLHSSRWIPFPTQSCLFLYSFCASLLHSLIMWYVSSLSTYNFTITVTNMIHRLCSSRTESEYLSIVSFFLLLLLVIFFTTTLVIVFHWSLIVWLVGWVGWVFMAYQPLWVI